jgi:hypothetical protein
MRLGITMAAILLFAGPVSRRATTSGGSRTRAEMGRAATRLRLAGDPVIPAKICSGCNFGD